MANTTVCFFIALKVKSLILFCWLGFFLLALNEIAVLTVGS